MRLRRALSSALCVLALAGVAACASQGEGGSVGSSAVGTGAVTRLEVTITGSTVTPVPSQVDLPVGSTLELVVTSDHDDELHAHGFDEEATLRAGEPATLRLTATEPGVYEVETHEPALTLLTVAVR
jgi:plastocyanin